MRIAISHDRKTVTCSLCDWEHKCRSENDMDKRVFEHMATFHDKLLITKEDKKYWTEYHGRN